jgi:hypothetical protein
VGTTSATCSKNSRTADLLKILFLVVASDNFNSGVKKQTIEINKDHLLDKGIGVSVVSLEIKEMTIGTTIGLNPLFSLTRFLHYQSIDGAILTYFDTATLGTFFHSKSITKPIKKLVDGAKILL